MSESKESLILAAKRKGFPVSSAKLARWQRNGLLPRPDQISLGRHGSRVEYLDGTTNQLIALCGYLKVKRNFEAIRWRLWWDGFPIKIRYVTDALKKLVSELSDFKSVYVDPLTGSLNDAGLKLKEQASTARLKKPAVAQARGRVRKKQFGGVIESFVQLFFGLDSRTLEEPERQEAVDKASGLEKARSIHGQTFVKEEYLPQLKTLLTAPDVFTFAENASEAFLDSCRAFLRLLLTSPQMRPLLEKLRGTSLDLETPFAPDYVADADEYAFLLLNLSIVVRDLEARWVAPAKAP